MLTEKNITPLCAFKDNYIWVFADETSQEIWVVDPGDAAPVQTYLKENGLILSGILLTHHHYDHSGGIPDLVKHWKNIPVFGAYNSTIPQVTHRVREGDVISCGPFELNILEIPGHTLDHIAYYNNKILFCGDTLFSMGCGKVFEGTPAQMYQSLNKLSHLSGETKIYPGHEYTLSNLHFAQLVDPDNQDMISKLKNAEILRQNNKSTLPSLMEDEKKLNPFLRCKDPVIIEQVEKYYKKSFPKSEDIFAHLREWKNSL